MTTETKRPGAHTFVALELAIEIVAGLHDVVDVIRRKDTDLAKQIVRAASSIAANLAEAGDRQVRIECTTTGLQPAALTKPWRTYALQSLGATCSQAPSVH